MGWCIRATSISVSIWPCKTYFSHPSLVIYFFFCNHTHKTEKLWTTNRWDTTNSKPLEPIIMMDPNQKHRPAAAVRSYLLHSFTRLAIAKTKQFCWAKAMFLRQTDIVWLFFIQFYCADHILSTTGDTLEFLFLCFLYYTHQVFTRDKFLWK
jgi:hypothetical protein